MGGVVGLGWDITRLPTGAGALTPPPRLTWLGAEILMTPGPASCCGDCSLLRGTMKAGGCPPEPAGDPIILGWNVGLETTGRLEAEKLLVTLIN